ncbi:MAG: hypothetical protein E7077_14530 [Bacteroidales bacterium]|jgi:putative lipoprotein (rSAM/lipoprotein system)|nr:hypothetical protein [Bacteroidales bacterium]
MKLAKITTWLLAILGFQMQSCRYETEEYGCPHTTFKTTGTVKDENGNKIGGAEVNVKIETIVNRPEEPEVKANKSTLSDNNGAYQVSDGRCDGIDRYETLQYEVITRKDGYKPDTIIKEVRKEDLKFKKVDSWDKSTTQEINVVLKKHK